VRSVLPHPLRRRQGDKTAHGFLVADVIVGRTMEEEDVKPFLRKCGMLGQLRGIRPFMPLLIADHFAPGALNACRSKGIIATRPETLFGRDVAAALADLLQVLSNAAAIAAGNPDRIEHLFKRLSAIEGSAGNLRGALFELLVGHMVKEEEGGSIDIGAVVSDASTGKRAEIDVRLVKPRSVTLYECKGYLPSKVVDEGEIKDWLERRIPTIRAAMDQEARFGGCRFAFEFWTSAAFSEAAIALLNDAKARTRKYKIGWRDGAGVKEYAREAASPGIRKILDEHYFAHPLAKPAKPRKARAEKAPPAEIEDLEDETAA
jgi:hypothetical protein